MAKGTPTWVDYKGALALVKAASEMPISMEVAGTWLLDRASSGQIRFHAGDWCEGESVAEVLKLHRDGDEGLWRCSVVFEMEWSGTDIKRLLRTARLGRPPAKPGAKPGYPWEKWIAAVEREYHGQRGWLKREAVIASLAATIKQSGGSAPSPRSIGTYADKIIARLGQAGNSAQN